MKNSFVSLCIAFLFLAFCFVDTVEGREFIKYDDGVAERAAVEILIDQFDSTDIVVTQHPIMEVPIQTPAFVVYATACAKLDGALGPLIDVLAVGPTIQERIAAAVALKEIGADAIDAEDILMVMLSGTEKEKQMAAGIIVGIGPDASHLVDYLAPNLYSDNFHTQYWTCRALASIGIASSELTPELCYLIKTGVASVRKNACMALGEIAPGTDMEQVAILTLKQARNDFVHQVKVAANSALEKFSNN